MSRTLVLLVVAFGAVACGSSGSLEGIDGPCTRTSDCQPGLTCSASGFCQGPDAGPSDAGGDGNDDASRDAATSG